MSHSPEEPEEGRSPLVPIIGIFILLILVASAVPYYSLKLDPNPETIPTIADVVPMYMVTDTHFTSTLSKDYPTFITVDPVIKSTADRIATLSGCGNVHVCQAKAIFSFVQQRFTYVPDPTAFEYIKTPREALRAEGGDCDDASVLLANLLNAIGFETRFVFIPRHVYIQVKIPEALQKYREGDWVNLDATCTYCGFGEIPIENRELPKTYV